MQESESQPDNKISPEQADAFAAELAPGWASEEQLEAETTQADGVTAEPSPTPIAAPAPPPVQRPPASEVTDDQTVKNVAPPVEPEAGGNEATEISIQQPEAAPTQPSLVTPEQTAPSAREVEVREMRRVAAAPATVQVRAPEYDDVPEARPNKGRALANLALILLGIGVGVASVVVYLEVRESNQPPNANAGFQSAEAIRQAATVDSKPIAAPSPEPTSPVRAEAEPSTPRAAEQMFEQVEQEVVEQPVPAEPKILLRLKTTPAEATVTVDGEPFENPFEGEVIQGGEHLFVARADGYETEHLRVRFDSDRRIQMDLRPVQKKTVKARRRSRAPARSPSTKRAAKPAAQSAPAPRKPATFVTDNPY